MKAKTMLLLLTILSVLVLLNACEKSICGNAVLEEGENCSTCCLDAGCLGEQTCANNTCMDPKCAECQYIDEEKHVCVDYRCCKNEDCAASEECSGHECKGLSCGACQYVEDHKCKDLRCCDDSDCNDNDDMTLDMCKFPSTKSAECSHEAADTCDSDSDCDDSKASTEDMCVKGSPNKCTHITIDECKDGDGYCPADCAYSDDDDCESDTEGCGTSISCFNDALEGCNNATFSLDMDVDDEEREQDITVNAEIVGWNDDDEICTVSFEFDSIDIEFTDAYREELLNESNTEDDIDDMLDDENSDADDMEGDNGECNFEDGDIDGVKAVLDAWKNNDFDVDDLNDYDCDGNFFD